MKTDYDIIIVGAGIVGSVMALSLAESGLRIALLEASVAPEIEKEATQRVLAITLGVRHIFQNLKVWSDLDKCAIQKMDIWDTSGTGSIQFDAQQINQNALGYIIANEDIRRVLWDKLNPFLNVTLMTSTAVTSLNISHCASVQTTQQKLTGTLIIAADGSQSNIRQMMGIPVHGRSYEQQAIVSTVTHSKKHHQTAWQQFSEQGTLAFLPLANGCSSIVWSIENEKAKQLMQFTEDEFIATLQAQMNERLGIIEKVTPRRAFPLALQYCTQYVDERIALIGDVIHKIHPLAGQGANLGIMDAASLAQVILQQHQLKHDFGYHYNLKPYERWRKSENYMMMGVMEGLQRFFRIPHFIVRRVRNKGLSMTHKNTWVKQLMMTYAAGLAGDLPELAQADIAEQDITR